MCYLTKLREAVRGGMWDCEGGMVADRGFESRGGKHVVGVLGDQTSKVLWS